MCKEQISAWVTLVHNILAWMAWVKKIDVVQKNDVVLNGLLFHPTL